MSGGQFRYANPRLIRWGEGARGRLDELLSEFAGTRAIVVTTAHLAEAARTGDVLFPAAARLDNVEIAVVGQHAPVAEVDAALHSRHTSNADVVVSFGGGSAIDAAKIVARGSWNEEPTRLPHIAIPTTLSVAELSSRAGFTDTAGDKSGINDELMLPSAVVYDPLVTLTTPLELWLSTGIRAVDHAVEGFLAPGEHPLSDVLAIESIARLISLLPRTRHSPRALSLRGESQIAAWFSYTLPGQSMVGLSHRLGKQIGARHGIPHGITSCLLLPNVIRYCARTNPARVAELSSAIDDRLGGREPLANRVSDLIRRLGLPEHIAEFGLVEGDLERAAHEVAGDVPFNELLRIYTESF